MNESKFYECNLPKKAPAHITDPDTRKHFEEAVIRITDRHARLQQALEMSGMKPETFQKLTSKLFKDEEKEYGSVDHFDSMTAQELCSYAETVYTGIDETEDRLVWQNADVLCDAAYTTDGEWAGLLRLLGIGGSESAVIAGLSPYSTEQKIWHSKRGDPKKFEDGSSRLVFDRGHFLEDNVIASFCRRTGAVRIRDTRMFKSRRYPHCIADIDAILRFPDGGIYVFEAKSTVLDNRDAWKDGKVPAYYVTQTRHYPAVLDDERVKGTYIGCLFVVDLDVCGDFVGAEYQDRKFLSRFIERDTELEESILEADETFWSKYIDTGIDPGPSGVSELDMEVIKTYSGPADPELPAVELPQRFLKSAGEYVSIGAELSKLAAKKKILDAARDRIKTEICAAMGPAIEGSIDLGGGHRYVVSYKPVSKLKTDTDALQAFFPQAFEQCVHEESESYRTFTIKEKDSNGKLIRK